MTTMNNKPMPVTAQDFIEAMPDNVHDAFTSGSVAEICSMQDKFDDLLSRARQEARSDLFQIIEDMAGLFVMLSPQESTRPNVKRAEAAYRKYLSITTKSA